jgi:cobalamin biosynthesis protein CbiD
MNYRDITFPVIKKAAFATSDSSATDVTEEFVLAKGDRLRIDILLSAKPSSGTGTISLYAGDHVDPTTGARLYSLVKSVTVDSTHPTAVPGVLSITLNPEVAGDQAVLPTPSRGIIKALSDGTGTFTISKISVLQDN